jgi:heme oxygenase
MDVAKALKKLYDMEGHGVPLQTWFKSKESEIGLEWREILRYLSLLNLTPEVQEMVSNFFFLLFPKFPK